MLSTLQEQKFPIISYDQSIRLFVFILSYPILSYPIQSNPILSI